MVDERWLPEFPHHPLKWPSLLTSETHQEGPLALSQFITNRIAYGLCSHVANKCTFHNGASASGLCSFVVFAVWADVEDFFLPGLCHFRSKKRITEARGCAFHAHLSLRRRLRSTCSVLRNERRYEIRNDRLGPPETQAGKD